MNYLQNSTNASLIFKIEYKPSKRGKGSPPSPRGQITKAEDARCVAKTHS